MAHFVGLRALATTSKHVFAALADGDLRSLAVRRLAVSVVGAMVLAVLPMLPAAPSRVHLAMNPAASVPWLDRFNAWRASTGTSSLIENSTWSAGDYNHALYMVQTGQVTHSESTAYPQYTTAGDSAAQNSNIFVSSSTSTSDVQAIDWWMGAPFHAMAMMDPRLTTTGFGSYRNVAYSPWQMGAAVDVGRGMTAPGQYPVFFPGNASTEPLTTYSGNETPDPTLACPGYRGLPLFIEVGGNVATTAGPVHSVNGNGVSLAHCVIDSTNPTFTNYLKWRGGVIVFPQQPLQSGVRYVVALTVNGLPYTWSFTVGSTLIGTLPVAAVLPAVSNGAYGGYVTAVTIQNTGTAAASVHIAYFDQNGAPVGAGDSISSLPVNASWTVRQDNGNSFPSSGGNAAQAGSAVVYSSQPVASFVNEFAPGNVGDATSYSGVQVPSGVAATLYAPTIVNNAYGGYTTGIGLVNVSAAPTNVTVTYRDGTGSAVKTQTVTGVAAGAYQGMFSGDPTLALPSGFAGTATITSSAGQSLAAIVNETGPGGQFSSYDAVPSGSTTLFAPAALNNAFGGYNTGMGIMNTGGGTGAVTINYYDSSGATTTTTYSIAANGSLGIYQGTDIATAGAYTAVIQSGLPLAVVVNEVAPAGAGSARQSTSYNTFSAGSGSLHLALVENSGSDPWNTGEGIMNTGTGSATVTVTYYDTGTGAAIGTAQTQVLPPHAFWGLYQPTGGLPSGKRATAVVTTSSGGQVAVICNEASSTTFMSYDGQ